ncbi:MAG: hypothetical protein AAFY71_09075 [Bacteroidota bacterium]
MDVNYPHKQLALFDAKKFSNPQLTLFDVEAFRTPQKSKRKRRRRKKMIKSTETLFPKNTLELEVLLF